MSSLPRITVVTPSYNQGPFLEETICSVLDQGYPNLEYLVIDGGSTDESVDIIRRYEGLIDYWCSERDEGQSDALNKGFARSTGHFLVWLNSDDVMLPGALHAVGSHVADHPDTEWISADRFIWIDPEGLVIRCSRLPQPSTFFTRMGLLAVGAPSTFFSRALYRSSGGLRLDLHYSMDTDLWWQFHTMEARCRLLPIYLMAFRFHQNSKTASESFVVKSNKRASASKKITERRQILARAGVGDALWLARLLHLARQLGNLNYFRAALEYRRLRNRHWSQANGCVMPPGTGVSCAKS
ncbi:MAG: glycosyltransferase family 2 protein [Chloroflexota bacterium]